MEATKNNTFFANIHTYTLSEWEVNFQSALHHDLRQQILRVLCLYIANTEHIIKSNERTSLQLIIFFYYTFVSMSSRIFVHIEIEWIRFFLIVDCGLFSTRSREMNFILLSFICQSFLLILKRQMNVKMTLEPVLSALTK